MAGDRETLETSTWQDVFASMESFLTDPEMQLDDQNLTYHEACSFVDEQVRYSC